MKRHIDNAKQKLSTWIAVQARSRYAIWILGVVSFLDAVFPIAPPDILLIPMIIANRRRWFLLTTLVLLMSFVGAVVAYLIGAGLFDIIGSKLIALHGFEDEFARVGIIYNNNSFLTLFGAAITPIPDTVFTIGAGVFRVPFLAFLFPYLLGRAVRMYAEAFVVYLYGQQVARALYKYFNIISLILIAAIVAVILLL